MTPIALPPGFSNSFRRNGHRLIWFSSVCSISLSSFALFFTHITLVAGSLCSISDILFEFSIDVTNSSLVKTFHWSSAVQHIRMKSHFSFVLLMNYDSIFVWLECELGFQWLRLPFDDGTAQSHKAFVETSRWRFAMRRNKTHSHSGNDTWEIKDKGDPILPCF